MSGASRFAAILLAAPLLLAADDGQRPLLRAQSWMFAEESADRLALAHRLTHAPSECLAESTSEIEIGRALFRSPHLLGGPAARAGLSCDACHQNGRDNRGFFLRELTDTPGAADVTSEWSSRTRGDGAMNPRRIPDLLDVSERGTFGQGHVLRLDGFVASVIMDEFQGEAPPPQAFDGLMAYLGALQSDACPVAREAPITLGDAAGDVRRALKAAETAEPETARLVLLAAQDGLGRIAERLPAPRFADERRELARLGRDLARLRDREDVAGALASAAPGWHARFDAVLERVQPFDAETFFNAERLRTALEE